MAITFKRGGLGLQSDSSSIPAAFADSMAKAMEDALNILLDQEGNPKVPVDNTRESRDRRTMFLAISRGIIDHLVTNQAAFVIRDNANNVQPLKVTIANE
jgi:hypothetical protein